MEPWKGRDPVPGPLPFFPGHPSLGVPSAGVHGWQREGCETPFRGLCIPFPLSSLTPAVRAVAEAERWGRCASTVAAVTDPGAVGSGRPRPGQADGAACMIRLRCACSTADGIITAASIGTPTAWQARPPTVGTSVIHGRRSCRETRVTHGHRQRGGPRAVDCWLGIATATVACSITRNNT